MFGGAYLDQKICRDCEHTYDREESFLSVSLPVKSRTLQESLKEHVKGEMLEGENAYLCEKCQEKVNLPFHPFLVVGNTLHSYSNRKLFMKQFLNLSSLVAPFLYATCACGVSCPCSAIP